MRSQISELAALMKENNIGAYIITDCDDHISEYTSRHFHAIKEFSGFTGGCGRLAVTAAGEAALWTDGRYFVAAEAELKGSGIELMRMGERGVPKLADWIDERLPAGGRLGFDGSCMPLKEGRGLKEKLKGREIISINLIDGVWKERPAECLRPVWILDEAYCGRSAADKIAWLRREMRRLGADVHIIASLDDIAWLLNLRGGDIRFNPVFMSYVLVTDEELVLYTDEEHFAVDARYTGADGYGHGSACGGAVRDYLDKLAVSIRPYRDIFEDIAGLGEDRDDKGDMVSILIDPARCNYELAYRLTRMPGAKKSCGEALSAGEGRLKHGIRLIERTNPVTEAKCIKNAVEIENLRIAQHKDSVALTKFMYWFKMNVAEGALTEQSCMHRLHELRCMQEGFIEESFATISAYGPDAAMVHYETDEGSSVTVRPESLYLVDSGGQYPEGTTDVTRTWSCGSLTDREREDFTLVVMANLRLADFRFPEGISGTVPDGAAREVLWSKGRDYNHGTGHGVGFCLNVHESPVAIRCRARGSEGAYPLKEGMYLSDEPGIYIEGQYGIRTENLLLVRPDFTNEFGRFMRFEVMNFCPIDRDCLDVNIMETRDIELLNDYHKRVYEELEADMDEEERIWLEVMCAPVAKGAKQ